MAAVQKYRAVDMLGIKIHVLYIHLSFYILYSKFAIVGYNARKIL